MGGRGFLFIGSLLAGCGVALGALGAHALKDKLPIDQMANFETAVRYQMYHAMALVLVGLAANRNASRLLSIAGWMFAVGILLFSGGLYGWIFTSIKPFVHIVPIGGTIWIIAWVCFAISQVAKPSSAGRGA